MNEDIKEIEIYTIEVVCDNCDYGKGAKVATKEIPYEQEVPVKMVCPKCGCLTLRKVF